MTRIRVPLENLAEEERELSSDTSRYLLRVHRLRTGDVCVAFDPAAALEADLEVLATGRKTVTRVRIENVRPASVVATRKLALLQALAKGVKVDAVVRDATELGATHIVLTLCERSVKRDVDIARCRRVAIDAARQCGRGDVPEITGPMLFTEACRTFAEESWTRALLSPTAPKPFGDLTASEETPVAIAVGPEGGFTPEELSSAEAQGFVAMRLGRFVLRTETACAAALGVIASAFEER